MGGSSGTWLIVSPAVTFGDKSRRMWEIEFPVDAARFNVFIGGSNRRGTEPPWNQEFFGASYFVGPNGRLPRIDSPEELVVADLDANLLRMCTGRRWIKSRRPELYKSLAEPTGKEEDIRKVRFSQTE